MEVEVVRLGAWCDLVHEDLGALSFRVEEFAVLSDGRRPTLTDDRGGTVSWSTAGQPGDRAEGGPDDSPEAERRSSRLPTAYPDLWASWTAEDLEQDVLNVVLPDDGEETGEDHSWGLLAARLGDLGVETTAERLRHLPYDVVLSDRILARLPAHRTAVDRAASIGPAAYPTTLGDLRATLSIRNLDEGVVERLRVRAARHGRSVEVEIREILNEAVAATEDEPDDPSRA